MADCLKRFGTAIGMKGPDSKAIRAELSNEKEALIKTKIGFVNEKTSFVEESGVPVKFKVWCERKKISWYARGNHPHLYPREFLNTLDEKDFTGLQELKPK